VALFFVDAPYGRHARKGWGPAIENRWGWFIMEAPAPLMMALAFIIGSAPKTVTSWVFLLLWLAHYIHRAYIYPFRIADGVRKMPLSVMAMAFVFNCGNGFINGRYLFTHSGGYANDYMLSWKFILGLALFVCGYAINRWADMVLRRLRGPGERRYQIPYGGLYRWVSCPNYLGEIIEWAGWAVATWSLPGLAFAVWTFSNLAPRARAHHRWYHQEFPDYPPVRKALIPLVW
jgi:protein-S-isoprenylcysteine O-methyltransferase Ste14